MRCVEVCLLIGYLIFPFAFILWFPGEVMIVGEPYRLVAILEANPHFYLGYVWNALLYLILPPAVGVSFILIGYVKEKKAFFQWQYAVAGGIILFLGLYSLWRVHVAYWKAMNEAARFNIPIGDLLPTIYATHSIDKILWIFAGVLSTHSYLYNTLRNEWSKYTKTY